MLLEALLPQKALRAVTPGGQTQSTGTCGLERLLRGPSDFLLQRPVVTENAGV